MCAHRHAHPLTQNAHSLIQTLIVLLGVAQLAVWVPFALELNLIMKKMAELHRPAGLEDYGRAESTQVSVRHAALIRMLSAPIGMHLQAWIDYRHEISYVEHEIAVAIQEMHAIRYLGGVNVFVLLVRFIQTWVAIPSLRVVSLTLRNTLQKMISFGFVMACLICLFGGAGMLMFGQVYLGYARTMRSLYNTWLCLRCWHALGVQVMLEFHSFQEAVVTTIIVFFTGLRACMAHVLAHLPARQHARPRASTPTCTYAPACVQRRQRHTSGSAW